MDDATLAALPAFVGALLAALLTLVWIGVHVLGLVRLASQLDAVSQRAKIAWGVSAVGGFMGPCVIVMALVGMGLALAERRAPDATDATRRATGYVLAAGAIILVMALVLAASAGVSVLLG